MFHSVNTAGDGRMTVDEFLGWATDKYGALTADDIVGFTDKFHRYVVSSSSPFFPRSDSMRRF